MADKAPATNSTENASAPAAPVDRVAELNKAIAAATAGPLKAAQMAVAQMEKAAAAMPGDGDPRAKLPEAFAMIDAALARETTAIERLTTQRDNEIASAKTAQFVPPMIERFGTRKLRSADQVNTSIPGTVEIADLEKTAKANADKIADLTEWGATLTALIAAVQLDKLPAEVADAMPPVHLVRNGADLTIKVAPKSGGTRKSSDGERKSSGGIYTVKSAKPDFAKYVGVVIGAENSQYANVKAFMIGEFPEESAKITERRGTQWTGVSAPAQLERIAGIVLENTAAAA